jgi:nicotinamide-nucleotide amidase
MNVEIISIGSELLLGEIVDTNATHIARELRTIGANLYRKTTVGDNQDRCAAAIDTALNRADVVITTGGLGPTVDDITREAVARATGRPLEFREDLLGQIEARFQRWGSGMSENNRRQAFVPRDAIAIENPVGTAPCFVVETERGSVVSLPGVPREMTYLLAEEVLPYLRRRFDLHAVIQTRILRTAALGESRVDTLLGELQTSANPTVGLSAHPGQTDVRITAKAESEAEAERLIAPLEKEIRRRLGDVIYGTGAETVEEVLLRYLQQAEIYLGTAEAGTRGFLAQRLSAAPHPAGRFLGGFVAPDTPALARFLDLGVPDESEEALERFVRQAAPRARALKVDDASKENRTLGLVVLTLSRASGEDATSAGGTLIGLATPGDVQLRRLGYGGHADYVATWATTHAMEMTRRWLLGRPPGG